MTITTKDYKNILGLIEIIYQIYDHAEMLNTFYSKLRDIIPFSSAAYVPAYAGTKDYMFQEHFVYNSSVKPMKAFCEYYSTIHPIISRFDPQKDLNKAIRITDIIPASRLADTEYGHDFQPMTPLRYELGGVLGSQGKLTGAFGIHRKDHEQDFMDRDIACFNLIVPHFSLALHNLALLHVKTHSRDVGVIVMKSKGTNISINDEGKRILNGRPIDAIPDPGTDAAPSFFYSERGVYRVRAIYLGRKEKIILLQPLHSKEDLNSKLSQYGLTSRQAEIALWVIRGLSNREIADLLFITEQTVKDHLRQIYESIGVHKRSQLIAKVMGFAGNF